MGKLRVGLLAGGIAAAGLYAGSDALVDSLAGEVPAPPMEIPEPPKPNPPKAQRAPISVGISFDATPSGIAQKLPAARAATREFILKEILQDGDTVVLCSFETESDCTTHVVSPEERQAMTARIDGIATNPDAKKSHVNDAVAKLSEMVGKDGHSFVWTDGKDSDRFPSDDVHGPTTIVVPDKKFERDAQKVARKMEPGVTVVEAEDASVFEELLREKTTALTASAQQQIDAQAAAEYAEAMKAYSTSTTAAARKYGEDMDAHEKGKSALEDLKNTYKNIVRAVAGLFAFLISLGLVVDTWQRSRPRLKGVFYDTRNADFPSSYPLPSSTKTIFVDQFGIEGLAGTLTPTRQGILFNGQPLKNGQEIDLGEGRGAIAYHEEEPSEEM